MENFLKSFDAKNIEAQIEAAIDQAEKTSNSVIQYVQPAAVRDNLVSLNKAYFAYARTNMESAKSFGLVMQKAIGDFSNSFEKVSKAA